VEQALKTLQKTAGRAAAEIGEQAAREPVPGFLTDYSASLIAACHRIFGDD
jgi:hypothetical protein